MNRQDVIVIGTAWVLINILAAYGAVKMLGDSAWMYVVFMVSYIYYCQNIGRKDD